MTKIRLSETGGYTTDEWPPARGDLGGVIVNMAEKELIRSSKILTRVGKSVWKAGTYVKEAVQPPDTAT